MVWWRTQRMRRKASSRCRACYRNQWISGELSQLVSASDKSLSLGVIVGILTALFSNVRGMTGMMAALNIAYGQSEQRGYIRFYATAMLLTTMVAVGGLIALTLVAVLPALLNDAGMHSPARWIGLVLEWPLLIVFVAGMLSLIYRYGPDGSMARWKWTSLGVITATLNVDRWVDPAQHLCLSFQ
jgi:membrane protein